MTTKVSDLMIDLATGDASPEDVQIQESVGRINVSSGIFEAAYNISELEDDEIAYVQEAATEAGLPTDKHEAIGVASEAVKREISSYYDLVVSTAKKLKTIADKNIKALAAVGKRFGVNLDMNNFVSGFAKPLCDEMFREDRKYNLDAKKFIKGKHAARLAEDYGKGMSKIMYAFDLSIDTVFSDEAIGLLIRNVYPGKKNEVSDLRDFETLLRTGGKLLSSIDKIVVDHHYESRIKRKEIECFLYSVYAVYKISSAIIDTAGSARTKKITLHKLNTLCDQACGGKARISRSCESINDGIKVWAENLIKLENNIAKVYNDSAYQLLVMSKKKI